MKFAIRDDDTNYWTKPEEIEKVYGSIWDKIHVSLATVPFVSQKYLIVRDYRRGHPCVKREVLKFIRHIEKRKNFSDLNNKIFPFGENMVLVNFLKEQIKKGRISIMLHGYSHDFYSNGYEFEVGDGLSWKVNKGKKYLEELFGVEIKTFVPPNNSLSSRGANAVIDNALNILIDYSHLPWERPFGLDNLLNFLRNFCFWIKFKKNKRLPYPIRFKKHREFPCYPVGPYTDFENLKEGVKFTLKSSGSFCLATHYYALAKDEKLLGKFKNFIDYVDKNYRSQIKYVKADDLFIEE